MFDQPLPRYNPHVNAGLPIVQMSAHGDDGRGGGGGGDGVDGKLIKARRTIIDCDDHQQQRQRKRAR